MKSIALPLVLGLLLCGCQDTEVIIKLLVPSWTTHSSFTFSKKVKFNSYSTGQVLYVYGPEYFSILDKNGVALHYATFFEYPFGEKFPVNNNFFVSAADNGKYVGFWPVAAPNQPAASVYLDMTSLDEYFKRVNFDLAPGKEIMTINDINQCLVPYYSDHPDNKISLYLFEIGNLSSPNLYLKKSLRITINEPANVVGANVHFVKGIDDYFIVSTGLKTYKVLSDGTVKQILGYQIEEAFKWGGDVYAWNVTPKVVKSSDNGVTWEEFTSTPASLSRGSHYVLGDSLVFNANDQVFSAKIKSLKYSLRELKNDGLEGNTVTSVTAFNDSIYATTYSGVFFKSRKEFFISKN